jgi:hypothetical protein
MLYREWKEAMLGFANHYVWHTKVQDMKTRSYTDQMNIRLNEMQDRRRRLIKYLYKKEGKIDEFEQGYKSSIDKKSQIIVKFSGSQLEELLRTSTKNVAQEVVQALIPNGSDKGLLVLLEDKYPDTLGMPA